MTLWFWHQVGGLLIEEFVAVRRTASQGQRLIDAVIVLGEKKRRLKRGAEFDLAGRDVIAVQSKHRRLGMTVAGQTLFSKELLKRFQPRSIRSVAVCTADDAVLRHCWSGTRAVRCGCIRCGTRGGSEGARRRSQHQKRSVGELLRLVSAKQLNHILRL